MFEVEHLKYATLATVSRCGMIWFSEDVLTTEMICRYFLSSLQQNTLDAGDNAGMLGKEEEAEVLAIQARLSTGKNKIFEFSLNSEQNNVQYVRFLLPFFEFA